MKKLIYLIVATLSVSVTYSQQVTEPIIIGSMNGAAPYSYLNDKGEPDGFAVEVIKSVMQKMGASYQFKIYGEEEIKGLETNELNEKILSECDLSTIAVTSVVDTKNFYFSLPYSNVLYHIISNKDSHMMELKIL